MKMSRLAIGLTIFLTASAAIAAELKIVHSDPEWQDGTGEVPDKGKCRRHGGEGWSPSLKISGIPSTAKSMKLMFTDDDWGSEGGHGKFSVALTGQTTIEIPPIGGKADHLPPNVTGGNGHHCSSCFEKDYLGPCSGWKGHTYRVNIYAENAEGETVAKGTILLGSF